MGVLVFTEPAKQESRTGEQRTGNRELGTGNWEWAISSLLESCAGGLRGSILDCGQLGCFAEESAEILVQQLRTLNDVQPVATFPWW